MKESEIIYEVIPLKEIKRIEPLWKELNRLHGEESVYFGDYFLSFTFEERCQKFHAYGNTGLRIEVARHKAGDTGYCIASISGENIGEIDSLFIKEAWRKKGIGARLVSHALAWMDDRGAAKKKVFVAYGHESVLPFYKKFGFYPRLTVLEQKACREG
jgi:GNAT superfamily N-acetyltransferase